MAETYCLWGSCKKFVVDENDHVSSDCCHDHYIVTGKPLCEMTLDEAKSKYPNTAFCEDWESD